MDRRERLLAYTLGALVLLSLIVGGVIIARGGLRPKKRVGGELETAAGAKLLQRNATTGELLWEVRLGDVTHEAGTKIARVREVECAIFTDGLEELLVNADDLLVDGEAETLTFETGVRIRSGAGSSLAYTGTADRMIYDVKADCVRLEQRAEFDYGRSKFIGSEIDLWFERVADSRQSRLARCEVTPMPPVDGKRAAVVLFALTAAVASAQPASQQEFRNATVRADRIVSSWAEGKVFLEGNPEVEVGDAVFTAEYIECQLDPNQPDRLLSAHTEGAVRIVSDKLLQAADLAHPFERRRTITLEARSAVYSAEEGTAKLEGGVTGTLKQPHTDGAFEASRVVAYFDAQQTVTKISAYGSPAKLIYDCQDPANPQYYDFAASEVAYVLSDPPRIVATGSPRVEVPRDDGADTYRASTITATLLAVDGGATVVDRVDLDGGVTWISESSKGSTEITCGHARAFVKHKGRARGLVEAREGPKVLLKSAKGEPQTEITCDEIDQELADQGKTLGRGNVQVKSLTSGAWVKGETLTGTTVEGDAKQFVLEGNPTGHSDADPEKATRAVDFAATKLTFRYVPSKSTVVIAESATATMLPLEEGDAPITIRAARIEADKKTGHLVATGRPHMRQGEVEVEADRIEATSKDKTTTGLATGNIVVRATTVRKPKKEGEKESVWKLVAHAERAEMTPDVAVPEGITKLASVDKANRYRLTGQPEIVMTEEGTGRTSTFRNVGVIDIYPLPDRNVLVDSRGADGPAEMHVENPTPKGGTEQ